MAVQTAPTKMPTLAPTSELAVGSCTRAVAGLEFYEIGNIGTGSAGTKLPISNMDDALQEIDLPFVFPFFGIDYVKVTVDTNGNLFFGAGAISTWGEQPVNGAYTRVAVAANDWDISSNASQRVLSLDTDDSLIVSWERGISAFPGSDPSNNGNVDFQVELYPSGDVEVRYGNGVLLPGGQAEGPTDTMFVGIESTNSPFYLDVFQNGPTTKCVFFGLVLDDPSFFFFFVVGSRHTRAFASSTTRRSRPTAASTSRLG